MKKFMMIYRIPKAVHEKMKDKSPEEMKKGMNEWQKWAKGLGKGLTDMGTHFGSGHKITDKVDEVLESSIAGYSVLQAESLDDAKKMVKKYPFSMWDESCSIELFECMPMPK